MPFDGTDSERVSEFLRAARRLLAERGWCKGRTQDQQGRVCLLWAIGEATLGLGWEPDIYGAAYKRVSSLIGGSDLSPWNDVYERTEGEVLALLDRAADG